MTVNIMVFVVGYEVRRRRVKKLFLIFVTLHDIQYVLLIPKNGRYFVQSKG